MSDTLRNKIQEQMVAAMRAQDKTTLGVIRLIQNEVKVQEQHNLEKDHTEIALEEKKIKAKLNDTDILSVLDKMIRQRNESVKQFEAAKRDDLVNKEMFEIDIIKQFLPEPLSSEALQVLIQSAIKETGATSIRDMSKVMSFLKPKVQGRADMALVGSLIKNLLTVE